MRIPSLDGLRAVSMLLVLAAHLAGTRNAPDLAWVRVFGDIGSLGVRIFFVISGFLMTVLLEREFDRTGRISIRGFLCRRALRILPAFGVYVGSIAVMAAGGAVALQQRDLLMSATFTMNYDAHRSWYVGHLWSLSVEAQFYVGWSVLRVLLGRTGIFRAALVALAAGPAARVAIHLFAPEWRWAIGEAFPTIVDALATGGLLAILQGRLASSHVCVRVLRSRVAVAAMPIAILALSAATPHIAFSYTLGETLMNVLIALMVQRVVLFPELPAGRLLNARLVAGFGAVSYSLYLWQQPFLNRHSAALVAAFPMNIALAIAAALLSYHFVERPALALGRRPGNGDGGATLSATSMRRQAHAAIS